MLSSINIAHAALERPEDPVYASGRAALHAGQKMTVYLHIGHYTVVSILLSEGKKVTKFNFCLRLR